MVSSFTVILNALHFRHSDLGLNRNAPGRMPKSLRKKDPVERTNSKPALGLKGQLEQCFIWKQ